MLEQIIGKKSHSITAETLRDKAQGFESVVVDFGCGDGMLPYRLAKQNPAVFYIGIDAAREPLAVASAKAAKKSSRGGCSNVIFLCANVLEPLPELEKIADELQWNFPWGSLMYAMVEPQKQAVRNMIELAKPQAVFKFYLNLYVFENDTQRRDMGLPDVNSDYVEKTLMLAWQEVGLMARDYNFMPPDALKNHPSTWAGRLVRRSGRNTLYVTGEVRFG